MENFFTTLWNQLASLAMSVGMKLVWAILIVVIGLKLVSFFCKRIQKSKFYSSIDESVARFISSALRFTLNCVVLVSAALVLGVPAASFVAVLGSAGLAVGLALQGSLSNLAGSVMIMIFRPYKIGDYVEVAGAAGTVEEINLFYTILNTPDNKKITIPNGTASNGVIVDYSTNEHRRVDFKFSVAYGTDVDKVKNMLLEVANAHPLVLKDVEDRAPVAMLGCQNESSLDIILRVWGNSADYWTLNFDILQAAHSRMVAEGIKIPYNQLDVHVTNS